MNKNLNQVRHFQVIPIAFVVAYENSRGELIAVSEHHNATTATNEARQLNHQREKACEPKARRTARCFEADANALNELGG